MTAQDLERKLRTQFCGLVEVEADDRGGYIVNVPFFFDDGDALFIRLKKDNERWVLTDEGNTLMRLTYQISAKHLMAGNRRHLLNSAILQYGVELREGRLILPLSEGNYGQCLADFIQAILKVSDLTFLTQDRTSSTFIDDFRSVLRSKVPAGRIQFDWAHPEMDPRGDFFVDARINHMATPLMVFAVMTTERALHAATNILQFQQWKLRFQPVVVFEDREKVSESAYKKLGRVSPTRFDDFYAQRPAFERYIVNSLTPANGQSEERGPNYEEPAYSDEPAPEFDDMDR